LQTLFRNAKFSGLSLRFIHNRARQYDK